MRSELAAMEAIAAAMASLPDDEARIRVLRWVTDRFLRPASPPSPAALSKEVPVDIGTFAPPAGRPVPVADLAAEDLGDLFESAQPARPHPAPAEPRNVTSMIHGFVEEFQQLARAWQKE